MVTINNTELLDKKGLEAIINENGEVVIKEKEVVLENGGKWQPKVGEPYYAVLDMGIKTEACSFSKFDPQNEFEKRHLSCGTLFPTQEMAGRVADKYIAAIKEEWEEYEKRTNALNGGNENERED